MDGRQHHHHHHSVNYGIRQSQLIMIESLNAENIQKLYKLYSRRVSNVTLVDKMSLTKKKTKKLIQENDICTHLQDRTCTEYSLFDSTSVFAFLGQSSQMVQ